VRSSDSEGMKSAAEKWSSIHENIVEQTKHL
jgi:hypothetical protein